MVGENMKSRTEEINYLVKMILKLRKLWKGVELNEISKSNVY